MPTRERSAVASLPLPEDTQDEDEASGLEVLYFQSVQSIVRSLLILLRTSGLRHRRKKAPLISARTQRLIQLPLPERRHRHRHPKRKVLYRLEGRRERHVARKIIRSASDWFLKLRVLQRAQK